MSAGWTGCMVEVSLAAQTVLGGGPGQGPHGRFGHTAVAVVAALVGVPLGMRVGRGLPQRSFERVTLAVLVLSTGPLVLEGLGIRPW